MLRLIVSSCKTVKTYHILIKMEELFYNKAPANLRYNLLPPRLLPQGEGEEVSEGPLMMEIARDGLS
jgi:hypothetical protein